VKRRDADWLRDILDAIDEIEKALGAESLQSFKDDRILRAAVSHFLLVISEASRHVPAALKADFPLIVWGDIAKIGNRIRHGYFSLDPDIMWGIHEVDLPALRHTIEEMLRRLATKSN